MFLPFEFWTEIFLETTAQDLNNVTLHNPRESSDLYGCSFLIAKKHNDGLVYAMLQK